MSPSQGNPNPTVPKPTAYLTPECKCVQEELMDLAAGLDTAALREFAMLVPTFLNAVREFRKHLNEHASSTEAPAGLLEYLSFDSPNLGGEIAAMSGEHCLMDACLAKLERQLERFNPTDAATTAAIRLSARDLNKLTCCHHDRGSRLMRRVRADGMDNGRL